MAFESNSLSYFDGILGGVYAGRNYYVKNDFIFDLLEDLSKKNARYRPYFKFTPAYLEQGYPFGRKILIGEARKSCKRLKTKQGNK